MRIVKTAIHVLIFKRKFRESNKHEISGKQNKLYTEQRCELEWAGSQTMWCTRARETDLLRLPGAWGAEVYAIEIYAPRVTPRWQVTKTCLKFHPSTWFSSQLAKNQVLFRIF